MSTNDKVKTKGEVFTPRYVVDMMLSLADYRGEKILEKHVIDNSSGTGIFLERIVEEYAKAYYEKYGTYKGLKRHLEKYIHGIEISRANVSVSIQRLNIMLKSYYNVDSMNRNLESKMKWDIRCENTLEVCEDYYGKMDYVFANPPYVRIHNIKDFDRGLLHKFSFARNGMSDLYVAFYEIGFKMLSKDGKMCYISPSSWFKSVAAREMRKYIFEGSEVGLRSLIDFGHFQPFSGITTYVAVAMFDKEEGGNRSVYELSENGMTMIGNGDLSIEVSDKYHEITIRNKYDIEVPKNDRSENLIKVKNGFATLADKVFICDNIDTNNGVIDVIKAQTNEWHKCIFPYNLSTVKPICEYDFAEDCPTAYNYLCKYHDKLHDRSIDDPDENWYLFGRTQGLNDLNRYKISVQSLVKDPYSIKMSLVEPGCGVYGGLYVVSDDENISAEELYSLMDKNLRSVDFMKYVQSLRHYKSGGYYTFNSKELEDYLNYKVYGNNG